MNTVALFGASRSCIEAEGYSGAAIPRSLDLTVRDLVTTANGASGGTRARAGLWGWS
jgi:hypothetical protein